MKQPAIFIPHGGGPCFFLNSDFSCPPEWMGLRDYLAGLIASLPERPRAILLISAHWIEPRFTVHSGDHPGLLFDYYGFPEHTYSLRWDAPGAPDLAHRAADLLRDAGFDTGKENERGWDHGVFVPMKVALPDADIPVAQLSLARSASGNGDFDAALHIRAGQALAPLRDEGVLILGSGYSFHNLRLLGAPVGDVTEEFDRALADVATDADPKRRADRLADWARLPHARTAHPPRGREDHLIPLMVVAGAGSDDTGVQDYSKDTAGWTVSAFRYG